MQIVIPNLSRDEQILTQHYNTHTCFGHESKIFIEEMFVEGYVKIHCPLVLRLDQRGNDGTLLSWR